MKTLLVSLFTMFALGCMAQVEVTCPDCGHKILVNITANGVSVQSASDKQMSGALDTRNTTKTTSSKGIFGQCKATTKKGTQCSRKAVDDSGYCNQHKNMYGSSSSSSNISSLKSSTSTTTSSGGRCKAKTKNGKPCSRTARSNGYCWQHGG